MPDGIGGEKSKNTKTVPADLDPASDAHPEIAHVHAHLMGLTMAQAHAATAPFAQFPWMHSPPTVSGDDAMVAIELSYFRLYDRDVLTFTQMVLDMCTGDVFAHIAGDGEVVALYADHDSSRDVTDHYYWLHRGLVVLVHAEHTVSLAEACLLLKAGEFTANSELTARLVEQLDHYQLKHITLVSVMVDADTERVLTAHRWLANRAIAECIVGKHQEEPHANATKEVTVEVNLVCFAEIMGKAFRHPAQSEEIGGQLVLTGLRHVNPTTNPTTNTFTTSSDNFQKQMIARHRLANIVPFDRAGFLRMLGDGKASLPVDDFFATVLDTVEMSDGDDATSESDTDDLVHALASLEFADFADFAVAQHFSNDSDYASDSDADDAHRLGLYIDYDSYDEHDPGFVGDKDDVLDSDDDMVDVYA